MKERKKEKESWAARKSKQGHIGEAGFRRQAVLPILRWPADKEKKKEEKTEEKKGRKKGRKKKEKKKERKLINKKKKRKENSRLC